MVVSGRGFHLTSSGTVWPKKDGPCFLLLVIPVLPSPPMQLVLGVFLLLVQICHQEPVPLFRLLTAEVHLLWYLSWGIRKEKWFFTS